MKMRYLVLALMLTASGAQSQVTMQGNLRSHIDSLIDNMPGATPAGLYLQPGASSRTTWRGIIQDILDASYESANASATSLEYRVVLFTDTTGSAPVTHCVLERTPTSTSRYWGTFVFNLSPRRPQLAILCPHPKYDSNTGKQGFLVYKETGARAYFVSGTHRCNGTSFTPCDGWTTVCNPSGEGYRYSDQAHVVLGTFQLTLEEMLAVYPDLVVIQPHGFSKEASDPDLIVSNGTRYTPSGPDYLVQLCNNLLLQDNSLTFKVIHVDLDWSKLTATTNTQGRLINGSSDPCGTNPGTANGRFLHLEQAYAGLRDNESNWRKLVNAVALTFPAIDQIVSVQSGQWRSPSTWANSLVPTASDDVLIAAGHTVSVDDSSSRCHALSFADTSAHIDMNAYSRLNIYGDFSLAGVTHNVFSAGWSPDSAFVYFVGAEPLQRPLRHCVGYRLRHGAVLFDQSGIDAEQGGFGRGGVAHHAAGKVTWGAGALGHTGRQRPCGA